VLGLALSPVTARETTFTVAAIALAGLDPDTMRRDHEWGRSDRNVAGKTIAATGTYSLPGG
jgi:hypothetical protein